MSRQPNTDPRTPGTRYRGYSGEVDTVLAMWTDLDSKNVWFEVEGEDGQVRQHASQWRRHYTVEN